MIKIEKWNDCEAIDEKGKTYLDLTAGGIFAAMFGPGSPTVKSAMARVEHFCSYSSHYGNYWRDKYIEMLKEFTGFESIALFSTGSEATEGFWRACRVYNGKPNCWGGLVDPDECGEAHCKSDQFHGWTLGAMIMSGRMTWHELGVFPELGAERFGKDQNSTACMIMEPYHAPSAQFHRIKPTIERIRSLQNTYPDIPLCLDEVQGGFGRTGKLFAYQHYIDTLNQTSTPYLRPQFVTIGKLCGGGLPLAALLGPREIMESDSVKEFGQLHSTHSGNPVMCSVGCAIIDRMREENLIFESQRKGLILHEALLDFPVRTQGKGLLAGLEFQTPEECNKAVDMCHERSLLVVDTGRQWIKLGPALTITDEELIRGINILRGIVEEVVHGRPETCGDSGEVDSGSGADISSSGIRADQPGETGGSENGGSPRAGD